MRLPLITTPLAVISLGSFFVHGLVGSGCRRVAKIFTTEFSTALDGVAAVVDDDDDDEAPAEDGLASGVGVTAGGLVSAGAADAVAITEQKISGLRSANIDVRQGRG
jgi:hypothetical protein